MSEKISVIVPIYGIEPYLRKCIESIMAQTYQNLEIILVDDGSRDGCPQICDEYAAKDERIRVIHKPNGGLVNARKTGLLAATAELIGYVDGDDWIAPDFYENLYRAYEKTHADIVTDGFCRDLLNISERITNRIPAGLYTDLPNEIYPRMLCAGEFFAFGIYSYVWNKLFRKEVLFDSQMAVDERIVVGEDVACTFPTLLRAKRLCVIDACAYHYEQRAGSMLKTTDNFAAENQRLDVLEAFMREQFENSVYRDLLLPQLERYMQGIRMIRGDSGCRKGACCHPFGAVNAQDLVAVYSAGTFGQNLVSRITSKKCCRLSGWFDKDYEQYRLQGLDVQSPEAIKAADFDKIIIASLDNAFSASVVAELTAVGVGKEKILTLYRA